MPGGAPRILVVKAAGIGDLVLAVPALRGLRHRFPDARIDLLVTPKCSELLKYCPYVDDIHVIRTRGMFNRIRAADVPAVLVTLLRLRARRYHALVNLYHLFSDRGARRMHLLCRIVAADRWYGRDTDGRGGFYHASVPDSWEDPAVAPRHEVDWNRDVAALLGAEDPGEGLEFRISDAERAAARRLLAGLPRSAPRVLLHVGADAIYKRWPADRFAALGREVVRRTRSVLLVAGGPDDRGAAEAVCREAGGRALNLAGRLSILELAAVLEQASVAVCHDSGPMHLAAALGRPVVALFGPGRPERYGPYGPPGLHQVVRGRAECAPCTRFHCTERRCMLGISVADVLERVLARIEVPVEATP